MSYTYDDLLRDQAYEAHENHSTRRRDCELCEDGEDEEAARYAYVPGLAPQSVLDEAARREAAS